MWDDCRKVYPEATGSPLDDQGYFEWETGKIFREKYTDDAPLFDYFSLMSISQPGPYDWILLDSYSYAGINTPTVVGWLVSKKFKEVLEKFEIDSPFRFYESRLMYQGEKYEYYVFQLCSKFYYKIDFKKSTWQYSALARKIERKDYEGKFSSFDQYSYGYGHFSDSSLEVFPKKTVFKKYCDLMFIYSVDQFAISERLKNAILEAGITGLDITPIDHIEFEFEEGPEF